MVFLESPNIELLYKGTKVQIRMDRKDAADIVNLFGGIVPGEEYDITIKKQSVRRSLNANNYHWMLCEQMARILKTSKYQVHNQLLIDYGTDWLDSAGDLMIIRMADDDSYLRSETMHFRPTDATDGDGKRFYILLLPSHLMDTAQMSALIDGTVSEAKELGIDTRTPDEIERMKALWETQRTGRT